MTLSKLIPLITAPFTIALTLYGFAQINAYAAQYSGGIAAAAQAGGWVFALMFLAATIMSVLNAVID